MMNYNWIKYRRTIYKPPSVVMSGFFARIGVLLCETRGCNDLGVWHNFVFDIDGTLHPCRLCLCDWCRERVQSVSER